MSSGGWEWAKKGQKGGIHRKENDGVTFSLKVLTQ